MSSVCDAWMVGKENTTNRLPGSESVAPMKMTCLGQKPPLQFKATASNHGSFHTRRTPPIKVINIFEAKSTASHDAIPFRWLGVLLLIGILFKASRQSTSCFRGRVPWHHKAEISNGWDD